MTICLRSRLCDPELESDELDELEDLDESEELEELDDDESEEFDDDESEELDDDDDEEEELLESVSESELEFEHLRFPANLSSDSSPGDPQRLPSPPRRLSWWWCLCPRSLTSTLTNGAAPYPSNPGPYPGP